jgi:hypothetical protein
MKSSLMGSDRIAFYWWRRRLREGKPSLPPMRMKAACRCLLRSLRSLSIPHYVPGLNLTASGVHVMDT